ncbi:hypothetical protein PCLA_05f0591 [Pseudomonas citronellolis]|nr:hypothetical protein PCLA_05f0591 [Pseudomonas citronellolis]
MAHVSGSVLCNVRFGRPPLRGGAEAPRPGSGTWNGRRILVGEN